MKIAIDARLIHQTGVGRYIRNLIAQLGRIDSTNRYILYVLKKDVDAIQLPNNRWEKKVADVRWHSITEQIIMPFFYFRDRPDLVHVPYFNIPVVYPGRFIVTIHDLTILHMDTGKASTLPYGIYKFRRFGYRVLLWAAMKRAHHIIAVSQTVKKDILAHFSVKETDVTVTYEGIDDAFISINSNKISSSTIPKNPYFLYVGNVYPHKNIEILLEAFRLLQLRTSHVIHLLLVGPSDFFSLTLKKFITSLSMSSHIEFRHTVADSELVQLYAHAEALVFPSRMEGFGLPALEALSQGCPVIVSDSPIFREILHSHAHFADTTNAESLSRVMSEVCTKKLDKKEFKKSLVSFLSAYSWKKMALETYHIYESIR